MGPENIVIAVAGNKCDLEEQRVVDHAAAEEYVKTISESHTPLYIETSAKEDKGVHDLFVGITSRLPDSSDDVLEANGRVNLNDRGGRSRAAKGGGGCC